MANTLTGAFETLVAATTSATQSLQFSNAMIDCVYRDLHPIATSPGVQTTLNVNIPTVSEGNVNDIGGGPLTPIDTDHTTVSIPFNRKDSVSFVIKSWDEFRSPENLKEKYIQPNLEALLRKINRRLANFVTSTNFNSYTAITGAGTAKFQRADMAAGWANLVNSGVNVQDEGNVFFVVTPTAYSNMMADTTFYQQNVVGDAASAAALQRAMIAPGYNALIRWDQQIPLTSTKETGLFFHRNAIAMVAAPLPPSGSTDVKETYVYPRNKLPVQLQMQYSLKDQGWLIAMNCAHGETIFRANHGSFMSAS